MNLPIYRAKKINNDEYVEGYYLEIDNKHIIIKKQASIEICGRYGLGNFGVISQSGDLGTFEVDPTTLAIHFPDMIDSQGKEIFASLSEDGKGGDIVEYNGIQEIIKYSNGTIQSYMFRFEDLKELNFKAIGIQE